MITAGDGRGQQARSGPITLTVTAQSAGIRRRRYWYSSMVGGLQVPPGQPKKRVVITGRVSSACASRYSRFQMLPLCQISNSGRTPHSVHSSQYRVSSATGCSTSKLPSGKASA